MDKVLGYMLYSLKTTKNKRKTDKNKIKTIKISKKYDIKI